MQQLMLILHQSSLRYNPMIVYYYVPIQCIIMLSLAINIVISDTLVEDVYN